MVLLETLLQVLLYYIAGVYLEELAQGHREDKQSETLQSVNGDDHLIERNLESNAREYC